MTKLEKEIEKEKESLEKVIEEQELYPKRLTEKVIEDEALLDERGGVYLPEWLFVMMVLERRELHRSMFVWFGVCVMLIVLILMGPFVFGGGS